MHSRLAVAAGILALALLSFFQFPGHTWLGSDTQIYVPMLEHIWDPSALTNDLVATKPHLAYTLYDEISIALRWITHSSFHAVLTAQQLIFRALQILGVYLLALSFPLARKLAMLVAALFTLGATISGPAVLIFEYEPVPRAFAVGLVFLAIGLAAQNHLMWADIAAALAFLYHPPTVVAFWALYLWFVLRHRDFRDLWPLAIGIVALFVCSRLQPGATEPQVFFSRVGPELEKLQRMRAAYNWISTWSTQLIGQYIFLWIASLVAIWRIRPRSARLFLSGMPALGILSIPLSYLLLEKLKWGLVPQAQPARAVLFVTAFAMILGAAAGIRAAENKRWLEALLWFALILGIPARANWSSLWWPRDPLLQHQTLLAIAMAAALTAAVYLAARYRWAAAALAIASLVPFFVWPGIGRVRNYPKLDLANLEELAQFARSSTPKDAVFLFADARQSPYPSLFRAEALRALYVDWKSGGQINFSESLGFEWWHRWQQTRMLRFDPAHAADLQPLANYIVLQPTNRLPNKTAIYENPEFIVYQATGL